MFCSVYTYVYIRFFYEPEQRNLEIYGGTRINYNQKHVISIFVVVVFVIIICTVQAPTISFFLFLTKLQYLLCECHGRFQYVWTAARTIITTTVSCRMDKKHVQ